jgi:PPP family 3-phenylpropionic acid transporter
LTRAKDALPLPLYYAATFAAFGAYLPYFPAWLEGRGVRGVAMSATFSLLPLFGVVGPPLFGLLADALALRGWVLRVACLGAALPMLAVAALEANDVALGLAPLLGLVALYAFFRSPMIMMADVVNLERVRDHGATTARRASGARSAS